ncbi:PilN domain-containing protein [Ensifer sp. SSB1]|uniref:PilN domain-containing protein n=1 Tax=Ensifer sp. SSB1 TaxID=2795385 RepID=UPI001A52D212|nr:PilN domain-containing protein [Ensifer sp. SSB1]MBK5571570.1 PilN domain-containing protein [Ensifer sp. SSB1]
MGILRDFWDWWVAELGGIRPSPTHEFHGVPVLKVGRRTGQLLSDGLPGVDLAPEEYGQSDFVSTKRTEVQLLLGEGRYILREISDRNIPKSRAKEMAAIDLADRTPFSAADVRIALMPVPGKTSYIVVRKDVIEPWLQALPKAKTRTVRLGVEFQGQPVWLPVASARNIDPRIGPRRWRHFAPRAVLSVVALSATLTFVHLASRNSSALASLDAEIADHRQDAIEIRKMLDVRAQALEASESARARKAQAVPLARVWEELTRTLPDTTYITDLTLDGESITFSGFADFAAQLIGLVDASESFERPILTGPVSRVPGRSGEQFQIRASVSRP